MKQNNKKNENVKHRRIKRESPLHQLLAIAVQKVLDGLVEHESNPQIENTQDHRKKQS